MSTATDKLTINLLDRKQAWAEIQSKVFPFLATALQSGRRWVLTLRLETRSMAQNRRRLRGMAGAPAEITRRSDGSFAPVRSPYRPTVSSTAGDPNIKVAP